jgi:glutaredoxin
LTHRLALAIALLLAALPGWAQYKVVGPDGRVTYTDRPPADASARVTTLGREQGVTQPAPDAGLPIELRQPTARFPVTLYAAADCPPCDKARQLLQQRGVPYTEKRIVSEDDAVAFERIVGARTIPGATIGTQVLRGFSPSDWSAYLDAAGYPRESRLPRNWQPAAATPLVAHAPIPELAPDRAAPAAAAPPPAAPATGLRF